MKIAIVNDMMMAVAALQRVLATMPEHQVIWTASNGEEAVRLCAESTPELVLMDLFMPVMDGVEATRRIMANSPCPVLVVTATVEGHSAKVYEALGAGALDAVATPVLGPGGVAEGGAAFREKIAMIGVLTGNAPRRGAQKRPVIDETARGLASVGPPLVVIGASAGGPAALSELLGNLPDRFPSPVIVVQHVDAQFAAGMAGWLDGFSTIRVRVAQGGESPAPGVALLAGTNDHLVLARDGFLQYVREPLAALYRPSVDVMFQSVLQYWKGSVIAILLTGMGRDGAAGLKALREAGALTIAQDRDSCTVYGMPKAAAEIGAAQEILPLNAIAGRVSEMVDARPGVLSQLRPHAHG